MLAAAMVREAEVFFLGLMLMVPAVEALLVNSTELSSILVPATFRTMLYMFHRGELVRDPVAARRRFTQT